MKASIKIGFIGVGGIAIDRHIPAFARVQTVALTAVYDVNEGRAMEVAKQFHIPHVATSRAQLLQMVDAVVICTPNRFHHEAALEALQAGVHVLCEKPMALTEAECLEMESAAKTSGCVLQIAYHYRFHPQALAAKQLVQAGEIGEPLVIKVEALRRRKVPGWGVFTNRDLQGGGCLMDYGCHLLDLALWLADFPPVKSVHGQTYAAVSRDIDQVNEWGTYNVATMNVEDHASAYITFASGATMLFETSWAANIPEDRETVRIAGTEGGIDLFPLTLNKSGQGLLTTTTVDWSMYDTDQSLAQAQQFIASCLGEAEPHVRPEEARMVSAMIERIYEGNE
ncbi:Gfo/Idh/MocA family protein [Shouchella lonarensis]|uniref:Predicted dehydrogenase n=1 Tax=Shouchella lonarensis TaxID=1464122 RepID=A0A1G6JNC8_9BACI|nr:Gfo/Idh/MocA family oxidoreductase [Shouchella lonarensis]SDC20197.1 Predicted dehydrogenase [Shouchella lonarensis]